MQIKHIYFLYLEIRINFFSRPPYVVSNFLNIPLIRVKKSKTPYEFSGVGVHLKNERSLMGHSNSAQYHLV